MNEPLFKETFSRLRVSERRKKELLELTDEKKTARPGHGLARPLKTALICAAAVALAATTLAAGEYLGDWREARYDDDTLRRGPFEQAHRVPDDTPDDPSDDMLELPHFLFGKAVQKGNGQFKVYIFLARGTETLFDQIIDVRDKVAFAPDHTYEYFYEDADVRVGFTVTKTDDGRGYTLEHDFFIRDPATDKWEEAQGSYDSTDAGASCGTVCYWYSSDDGIHEPILVPITWQRGPTVTGFGLGDFEEPERFE